MTIRVFGQSDDLIEIDGYIKEEFSYCGIDDEDHSGVLLAFSDGTILSVKYGKNESAIWGIKVLAKGSNFESIDYCNDEDDDIYSDVVYLKDGKLKVWAAQEYYELL